MEHPTAPLERLSLSRLQSTSTFPLQELHEQIPGVVRLIRQAVATPGGEGTICENVIALCRALPRLCHGRDDEGFWKFAFESAFGPTSPRALKDKPMPFESWSHAFSQVCRALEGMKDLSAGVLPREWDELTSWTPADVDAKLSYLQRVSNAYTPPLIRMLEMRGGESNRHRARVEKSEQLISGIRDGRSIDWVRAELEEMQSSTLVATLANDGTTALSSASAFADKAMVELLLDYGAGGRGLYGAPMIDHVNYRCKKWDESGSEKATALISASARGDEDMVRVLLERGANVNLQVPQSTGYWTALLAAARDGKAGVMDLLLQWGGDAEVSAPQRSVHGFAASHPLFSATMREVLDRHARGA